MKNPYSFYTGEKLRCCAVKHLPLSDGMPDISIHKSIVYNPFQIYNFCVSYVISPRMGKTTSEALTPKRRLLTINGAPL